MKLFARFTKHQQHVHADHAAIHCTAMLSADSQGLTLLAEDGQKVRVNFAKAAQVYHAAEPASSSRCVGNRDIIAKRFEFAGDKQIILRLPLERNTDRFYQVQNAIRQAGYNTFDLT